ncbi:hypothetical protein TWF106_007804 [Orbilia oligospora]|uniref:PITH domain-containing protein n=1 Tax=Orbilia oligospora TaxID=2813651 RepID=A0A6G1MMQ2_ORBOL|nr:hypothetical protein TWF788_010260 [Orbilia oligospora]KAF3204742.1 hypothetical protein TWF679_009606 [Orbilia oligospora]KAF3217841.1 hypothetical protein TWF106_007804 [Orbilia oligospora]KAF3218217.1 hypothetical protein TWF191_008260 [Orbilia oligospora]KAF3261702.1 hypothetical protein TWF192_008163 [Orbilia oligospora]
MSHCHHEHTHGGGGDGHDHDHAGHTHDDDVTPAIQSSLYNSIDFDAVSTLNESEPDAGKRVLRKTWDERLETTPELESDSDQELIMFVPFAGIVKLHSLLIYSPPDATSPRTLKLFINRTDVDFSNASSVTPTQTLEIPLVPPSSRPEITEIPLKRALFNNVRSLTLFFEENHSYDGEEEVTKIWYLGFRGDFMKVGREPVITLYEAAANPRDHVNLVPGEKHVAGGSRFGA